MASLEKLPEVESIEEFPSFSSENTYLNLRPFEVGPNAFQMLEGGTFTPGGIFNIWSRLPEEAMIKKASEFAPEAIARSVILGEKGRVLTLAEYLRHFYQKTFAFLQNQEVEVNSWVELGPSFGTHLAALEPSLQPGEYVGLDNNPLVVGVAQEVFGVFKKDNLIPTGYRVESGDHALRFSSGQSKADLALASLTSMYEGGIKVVEGLLEQGEIAVNCDCLHSLIPISQEEFERGLLPVRSPRTPELETGIYWKLGEFVEETAYGKVFEAEVCFDPERLKEDKTVHIPVAGDNYEGRVTVRRREDGELEYMGLSFNPTDEATEEDVEELAAMHRTIYEIFEKIGEATGGERWDAIAAAAVPAYLAQKEGKDIYTALMLTTLGTGIVSGKIIVTMLKKFRPQLELLHSKGLLSQVGEGKRFLDLDEVDVAVNRWLPIHDQKITMTNPIILTTLHTTDRERYGRIVQGFV